jgi:hypothetical protein
MADCRIVCAVEATRGFTMRPKKNTDCPPELNDDFKAKITKTLLGWMVGDAKKAAANEAYVGALILGVCALDVLGGLYTGVEVTTPDTFKKFIKKYLPNEEVYVGGGVYRHMRNFLVHGYSTKGFQYTDEFPAKHLTREKGKLWIHVDSFVWEVETAARKYLDDLQTNDTLWKHFRDRWEYAPLLGPVEE